MNIYNGIYLCGKHNHLVPQRITELDGLGRSMTHCCYYGTNESIPLIHCKGYAVGCQDSRDNMALKTYGMLKHALTMDWDVFFKTDANITVMSVDWDAVANADYAGCVNGPDAKGNPHIVRNYLPKEREPVLREDWLGNAPMYWCYGSAYLLSRSFAQKIVDCGAWSARGYAHEDLMVACIAEQNGITATPAVVYRDEFGIHESSARKIQ